MEEKVQNIKTKMFVITEIMQASFFFRRFWKFIMYVYGCVRACVR